jgi:NADPH-dependent 2,4-dienoyl-CoA reductase/sulfur reductase-like enzyme
MTDAKYLLIGGGMASYHAAKQIRRADADGSILLVSEEAWLPYDRPPLSKELLRGEKQPEEIVFTQREAYAEEKIELRLGLRAERLDTAAKLVTLSDGEVIGYERALLATGARPVQPPIPGIDLAGVHYLRTLDDALAIAKDAVAGRRAAIIGGGFIGIEAAASLTQRGVSVTVIEALPHIWARFCDAELAGFFQRYCSERGVTFLTGERVATLNGDAQVQSVTLASGKTLDCDLVLVAVGVTPNVELARDAGLTVENGIVVDEQLRTSAPDVYAAGDVIDYYDPIFGKRRRVEHWGHAEYSGQIAGQNMTGAARDYEFLTYVWSDVFDLHLEFAGDESERDQVLVRGTPGEGPFVVIYLKGGLVTAYFAINASAREFGVFRRLITTKRDVSGIESDLTNPEFNLRELLQ